MVRFLKKIMINLKLIIFCFLLQTMLDKMKLFVKMKIFVKIENEASVGFRKTCHKERENMENKQLFSICMVLPYSTGLLKRSFLE